MEDKFWNWASFTIYSQLSLSGHSLNRTANLVHSLPNCTCISVKVDTSLNWTVALVPRVSALERVDCTLYAKFASYLYSPSSIFYIPKTTQLIQPLWLLLLFWAYLSLTWDTNLLIRFIHYFIIHFIQVLSTSPSKGKWKFTQGNSLRQR